jgi:hypothetical protein
MFASSGENGLKFKEGTSEMLNLENSFVFFETWTLGKVDKRCLESFGTW